MFIKCVGVGCSLLSRLCLSLVLWDNPFSLAIFSFRRKNADRFTLIDLWHVYIYFLRVQISFLHCAICRGVICVCDISWSTSPL